MVFQLRWLARQHRSIILAVVVCVVTCTIGAWIIMRPFFAPSAQLLGDATAPRIAPTAPAIVTSAPPVIRPAAAPAPSGAGSGPARPSADRDLLATRLPDEQYAAPALAAIRCAATSGSDRASSVTTIDHDPTLDIAAADLWRATVAEPELELSTVAGARFAYVAAVPLTFAPDFEPVAAAGAVCPFAGMDFNQLNLSGLSAVGVAVFADADLSDGMDDSTMMIVGR